MQVSYIFTFLSGYSIGIYFSTGKKLCKQKKKEERKFDNFKTIRYNKLKVYYDYYLTIGHKDMG